MTTNPFEAPRSEARDPWRPERPGWLALGWFLFRRGLLVVLAPILLALSAVIADWRLVLPLVVAGAAVWLPTTTMILWARFAGRLEDPKPVVLASGLVLDRDRYQMLVRANATDRLILAVLLLVIGASFLTRGGTGYLAAVVLAALAFWMAWFAVNALVVAAATVAFFSEDYESAARRYEQVVAWRRMNWPFADHCRVALSNARVRLGDPQGALEVLSRVHRRRRQAHLARAQLLAGQGRVDEAHAAMRGRSPRNLGERLAWEGAHVLLALEEGRVDEAAERTRAWASLREQLPPSARGQLDLLEAAALQRAGDTAAARAVLANSAVAPSDRTWIASAFPTWWDALQEAIADSRA